MATRMLRPHRFLLVLSLVIINDVTRVVCKESVYGQLPDCDVDFEDDREYERYHKIRSMLECAGLCSRTDQCLGFTYTSSSEICKLTDLPMATCSQLQKSDTARYYFKKLFHATCALPWKLSLETFGTTVIKGSLKDLIQHVILGSRIRIHTTFCSAESSSDFTMYNADTVFVESGQVVAHAYTFVDGRWSMIVAESSGTVQTLAYGSSSFSLCFVHISWFVKEVSHYHEYMVADPDPSELPRFAAIYNPLLMSDAHSLEPAKGNFEDVESALKAGFPIQVVEGNGVSGWKSYTLYDFKIEEEERSGPSAYGLWVSNTTLEQPDFVMNIVEFKGVGISVFEGIDIAQPALEYSPSASESDASWYGDFCWEKLFANDMDGNVLYGSLDGFRKAINDEGVEVRLSYKCDDADAATHFLSCSHLSIVDDKYIQAVSAVSVTGIDGDEPHGQQVDWKRTEARTDGFVDQYGINRRNGDEYLMWRCQADVTWFVDTQTRREVSDLGLDSSSSTNGQTPGSSGMPGLSSDMVTTMKNLLDNGRIPRVGLTTFEEPKIFELCNVQRIVYKSGAVEKGLPEKPIVEAFCYRNLVGYQFRLLMMTSQMVYGVNFSDVENDNPYNHVPFGSSPKTLKWYL